ncbi:MAG: type II secretion system protein [Cyanobacteria bacterium SIG30]|nr:type II secretion system protein [Cyanobacteria bacterium SIG30]
MHGGGATNSLKAFTLAEVLITLAIIGVVAALTIPSVILNTNQTEYKSSLKKAVSVLNQSLSMRLATENDSPSTTTSSIELMNLITSNMNTVSKGYSTSYCNSLTGPDGGMPAILESDGCSFTTTDGMYFWLATTGYGDDTLYAVGGKCYRFDASAGVDVLVPASSRADCESNALQYWNDSIGGADFGCSDETPCYIIVDVNGEKGPNKATTMNDDGTVNVQDRFALMLTGKNGTKVLPAGPAAAVMYQK